MCILLARHRPAADGALSQGHELRWGISVRGGDRRGVTRLCTRTGMISQAPNFQTLRLAARLCEGPGVRREGTARGAVPACPAAAVSSPGEGKLAEEEEDHEAEFLGVSWRCPASKEGRILESRLSCRGRKLRLEKI
jgi:hypothetical protein